MSCFSDNEVLGGVLTGSQGHCLDLVDTGLFNFYYIWNAWFCNWDYMNRKFVQYRLVTVRWDRWTAMCNKTTLDWQSASLFDTDWWPYYIHSTGHWQAVAYLFYKNTNFMYNKLLYTGFVMVWLMDKSVFNSGIRNCSLSVSRWSNTVRGYQIQ